MNAVDTNVFIYAIDSSEPVKGPQALAFLDRLSANDTVLLWQVLCEFAAVISKLQNRGLATLDAMQAAAALRARFPLVMPDPAMLDVALGLRRDHGVSFWDSLLVAACASAGVDRLYTEDLQASPTLMGVRIVNPFQPD